MTKKELKFIGIEINKTKGLIKINFDKNLNLSKRDMIRIKKDAIRFLKNGSKKRLKTP